LLRRQGRDITCIAYSRMVMLALEAADILAKEGIAMTVIDLRSLAPIDWETCVQSVKQTHHCLIVEEDCRFAGAGAELSATLQERCFYFLDRPIQRVAGLDIPTPFNGQLEAASIPRTADIITAARQMLGSQGGQS